MQPRMTSPVLSVPGVMEALQGLSKATNETAEAAGVPQSTIELVGLRASQINGCAVCLDMHTRGGQEGGRDRRAALHLGGLARDPVLLRGRARRAGPDRGRVPPRGSSCPDSRLSVRRGGQALQRADACRSGGGHRQHQHLEPPQRHQRASDGRLGRPVGGLNMPTSAPEGGRS